MDKPVSISVKASIIRNMSVKMQVQESVIETVINHQFDSAYVALDHCNSMEFSGFGKFFFNRPKAIKKLEKFKSQLTEFNRIIDDPQTTEVRRRNILMKKESITKNFNYLNKKLNEHISDIRGMEEQVVPPKGIEGADSEGDRDENGGVQGLRNELQVSQDHQT